jgi:hypothetical protein
MNSAKFSVLWLFSVSSHPKLPENIYLSQENIWNFRVIQGNVVTDPTFSPNFDFEAQLFHEIFEISHPNFGHVFYN